jgi:hypothetical protein
VVIDGVRRFAGGKLNISAIERAVAEPFAGRSCLTERDRRPRRRCHRTGVLPGGACGPIFETPLLGLAFSRIRDFARSRRAPCRGHPIDPPADQDLAGIAPSILRQKDAPHD